MYVGYLDPVGNAVLDAPHLRSAITTGPTYIWGAMFPECAAVETVRNREGADLQAALADLRASPRVSRVRLVVAHDACPACRAAEGEFTKDLVPSLPVHGCSHARGCRCFYEPALVDIYP